MMIQVPLIVDVKSGVNDMLDRDGSRTPIEFDCGLGLPKPIRASVVQAATKWKRMALKQFDCEVGEGINTDMKAVRKDYFLDHDHSSYVDQWDWEKVLSADQRNLAFLTDTVQRIWKVIKGAQDYAFERFPDLDDPRYPRLPDELVFIHAEEILEMYPDLPRKQRETNIIQEHPAVFIYGIGWTLWPYPPEPSRQRPSGPRSRSRAGPKTSVWQPTEPVRRPSLTGKRMCAVRSRPEDRPVSWTKSTSTTDTFTWTRAVPPRIEDVSARRSVNVIPPDR
jgi:hypothetical protein